MKIREFIRRHRALGLVALGSVLVPSAFLGAQSLYSGDAGTSINCLVENSCNITVVNSPQKSDELRFGAVSGTQSATFPVLSTVSTTGSFLGETTFTIGVNGGTVVTGTNTGTTSTLSIVAGRTCLPLMSEVGTRFWFYVNVQGGFSTSTTSCED